MRLFDFVVVGGLFALAAGLFLSMFFPSVVIFRNFWDLLVFCVVSYVVVLVIMVIASRK